MQPSLAFAEQQQRIIAQREQRAAQHGEYRELVVRPFDGLSGVAQRENLLASVERVASDEHVGDSTRLERPDIGARQVAAPGAHSLEQKTEVASLERNRPRRIVPLRDRPAALAN